MNTQSHARYEESWSQTLLSMSSSFFAVSGSVWAFTLEKTSKKVFMQLRLSLSEDPTTNASSPRAWAACNQETLR
jgi:hypothetical protein